MQSIVDFFYYLEEFNAVSVAVRLILATVMGGIIGMERGATKHAAGLRTFMLVCLGAALAQIIDMRCVMVYGSGDPMRLAQGVINGIGFLGVGTIVVTGKSHIKGLTTAATLWTTAVLGISIGSGYLYSSIITFALIMLVIKAMAGLSRRQMSRSRMLEISVEFADKDGTKSVVNYLRDHGYNITEMDKKENEDSILLILDVDLGKKMSHAKIIDEIGNGRYLEQADQSHAAAQDGEGLFQLDALAQHLEYGEQNQHGQYHIDSFQEGKIPDAIQGILDAAAGTAVEVDGVGHTGGALDHQTGGIQGDQVAEDEQEQQLIQTVGEITKDQTADHFLALHLVQQLADQETEQGCNGKGHAHGQQETAKAAHTPFDHPQHTDLSGHGTDGNGEVDAHAGNDRNDQGQHDERVTAETAKQFVNHIGYGLTGENHTQGAQHHEHHRNGVVAQQRTNVFLIHESHLRTW